MGLGETQQNTPQPRRTCIKCATAEGDGYGIGEPIVCDDCSATTGSGSPPMALISDALVEAGRVLDMGRDESMEQGCT